MLKLLFNGEVFEAENISKTSTSVQGTDINGNEIFAFRGISDFAQFQLQDESGNPIDFPPQQPTEVEQLRLEMAQANTELFEMMLMLSGGAV